MLRLARAAYLAILVAVALTLLWRQRDELADVVADARWAVLLVALALSGAQLVLNASFWARALAMLGHRRSVRWLTAVNARAILGRYLPGGVWYQAGRIVVLRRDGVPGGALGAVALLDTALALVVAAALGSGLLLASGRSPAASVPLAVVCAVALALCTPPVLDRVLRRLDRSAAIERGLSWAQVGELAARMALAWLGAAAAFAVYLLAFPALDLPSLPVVAGSFLLAWSVGFLAIVAPQGAGVFEVTVVALLGGSDAAATLAVVVGGYRGLTLVRDLLATALASVRQVRGGRSAQERS